MSLGAICGYYQITRQAHYKHLHAEHARAAVEEVIVALVLTERREMPRLGGRKLYHQIAPELQRRSISYGRDKFFALLGRRGLLIEPKPQYVRTTDSKHGLRIYQNVLAGRELSAPHQAMVSDITYIQTREGFRYLSLIMDAYSRKIIGFDLSASLSIEGSQRALRMAIGQLRPERPGVVVHHSDRGVQYCSYPYIAMLQAEAIEISMAAVGNPYENAQAERLNGILKHEFLLNACFASESQARPAVSQAVGIYNTKRPHMALDYQTPEYVHAHGNATKIVKIAA